MRNWLLPRRADISHNHALSPTTSIRLSPLVANVLRAGYQIGLVVLVLFTAGLGASREKIDPLTAAQNERVMGGGPRREGDPVYADLPVNQPERLSIYYTGNSQVYAIMDYAPGDATMVAYFSDLLNDGWEQPTSRFAVRIGSEPNLRMSELLLKSVLLAVDTEHRPDVIVAGIVLDGLRWIDARQTLAVQANRSYVRPLLSALVQMSPDLPAARRVVQEMMQGGDSASAESSDVQAEEATAYHGPVTESLERWLKIQLGASIPVFRERRHLHEQFILYYTVWRNRVLGINTATPRVISPGMYQTNLELIEMTLRFLSERGVYAVFYFAPIRPIEPNPTQPDDVARFRNDLRTMCARYDVVCLDYSNLVPEEMWTNYSEDGMHRGERDFAHFTARAHRYLAEQLVTDVLPHLESWLSQKQDGTL